jgi:hypothetical protein
LELRVKLAALRGGAFGGEPVKRQPSIILKMYLFEFEGIPHQLFRTIFNLTREQRSDVK